MMTMAWTALFHAIFFKNGRLSLQEMANR